MMHPKRKWTITTYEDIEKLAEAMLGTIWTLCTGFRLPVEGGGSLLLLNDSTHEDAMPEYAVMRVPPERDDKVLEIEQGQVVGGKLPLKQIESLTLNSSDDCGGDLHSRAGMEQALFSLTTQEAPAGVLPITVALEASEVHEGECCA